MRGNDKFLVDKPRNRSGNASKITNSSVEGSWKQVKDRSFGKNIWKCSEKISFWRQTSCNSSSCFLFKILTKKNHQHLNSSFTKQHSNCDSFFLRNLYILHAVWLSYQIWKGCNASLSCIIHSLHTDFVCGFFGKSTNPHFQVDI